jgi:hypothetical protein
VSEVLPSPTARRIKPMIDTEMKKKAETAIRLKEKKLKGPSVSFITSQPNYSFIINIFKRN